ncbi:transposase, partial [Rhodobacteraceae bacterium G21628-S1]|nr:transposase [Rhodobacteraceae bacterium G21628-S1]
YSDNYLIDTDHGIIMDVEATRSVRQAEKVEMLFAHLKRILGLTRLRLRGPLGVKDEFTLAAIAQNLRKLAKLNPETAAMKAVG